jgi:hypothetical protein
MTDLISRLREHDDTRLYREADVLMSEAADRIAELEQTIKNKDYARQMLLDRIAELEAQLVAPVAPDFIDAHPSEVEMGRRGLASLKAACAAPVAQEPTDGWISVKDSLPEIELVVWLHEPQRGSFVGARVDHGDEWLWGNTYGSHFDRHDGTWSATSLECDDDYQPTHWMPLPAYPGAAQGEPVYCGCGDQIMPDDGARCGTCVAIKYQPAQSEPCTLCDGTGTLDGTPATCPNCDRTGIEPAQGERQPETFQGICDFCGEKGALTELPGNRTMAGWSHCADCATKK